MRTRLSIIAALVGALLLPVLGHGEPWPHSADIAKRNLKPTDFPRSRQLAPGIFVYEGLHAADRDGTVVNTVSLIVTTASGVVVVDGQGDEAQTRRMLEDIRKLTPRPTVRYVVIASDHIDHVGGNAVFREANPQVEFIASPVSAKRLQDKGHPAIQALDEEQRTLHVGGMEIQILNLGRAHTGGDLVAYLPHPKVLFLGEVYLRDVFPAMRSAHPTEWLGTIERAQAMDAAWYVPGHGFIDDAASMKRGLEESRKAITYVIDEAKRLRAAGLACGSPADCPAARQANWGPYDGWALRTSQAPLAIAKVYQELDGKLPSD
ncbi:MAG TPA: MBL fold metallo-hydrolase [Povalibacter sp.]|nr:MBL fold metallo-hydrolase [Povalibacter sp.]